LNIAVVAFLTEVKTCIPALRATDSVRAKPAGCDGLAVCAATVSVDSITVIAGFLSNNCRIYDYLIANTVAALHTSLSDNWTEPT
jgi:hypothetical protein